MDVADGATDPVREPEGVDSPGAPPVPGDWREERFDAIVGRTLSTAAAAGTILYIVFTVAHPFYFDPPALFAMVALGSSTAVTLGALWVLARRERVPEDLAQPLIAVGLSLALLNTVALSALRRSPEMTFWFALLAMAGGLLFLSWNWFTAFVSIDVFSWLWVAIQSPPDPGWSEFAPFVMLSAIALASFTIASRRRIYHDVLSREFKLRQINQQLDRARKHAEAAEQTQSQFLANVSHDVRNPLSAIIGETELLQASDPDPEQEESLETIEASARHLLHLIDDILDMTKVEAGQLSVEEEPFQLERVLEETLEMVQGRAEDKGLTLERTVADDVPEAVTTDPHRLQQILGNLVTNAVKFTEEGEVRVQVTVERSDPLELRFEVTDTGSGIPEDRQEDLFQPFIQLDRRSPQEEEGTGLGLAICNRLVDLLGGEIGVESTVGEGSTFWFTLPCQQARTEDVESPGPAAGDSEGEGDARLDPTMGQRHPLDVLVVEDDPISRRVLQRILERLGYEPDLAEDGQRALNMLLQGGYDLALVDLQIPEVDGFEVARRVREEGPEDDQPRIVALTGRTDTEATEEASEAGMDAHVTKPVDVAKVLELLEATPSKATRRGEAEG